IRDIELKRNPLVHHIISLRRRFSFLYKRRWDLNGILSEFQKKLKALLSNKEKLLELPNTPLNENCSTVILKKLPEKLGDPRKFLIPCGFSELKCKALADLRASINLLPLSIWKNLGLPEFISTRMTLELANRAICTPAGIAREVFVLVGKFTFHANFIIVDYESDHRVPLILGRPFLRTTRALIDVHGEEMIFRDGDERLTLNMRYDTSSYLNQPQKESINMINIYGDSCEDYLKDLFATNHLSGNPTFSSLTDLTSLEVINPLSGSTTSSSPDYLLEEFIDELTFITFPHGSDDLPFDIESDLREIEYLLNHDPTKEMDSILKDSEKFLLDLNNDLVDTIPEMVKSIFGAVVGECMRTRSSLNLVGESSPDLTSSNLKRRNRRRSKQPFILEESPIDTMADQRTMYELLRAATEGYAEAIVVPPILAEHFKLKHSLINMMTSDQIFGLEKDNPYDHIRCAVTTAMTAILKQFQATPPPASVKAVEKICVTCGGAHPYYHGLTVDGNTFLEFRDNIQGYVSAVAVNYNQEVINPLSGSTTSSSPDYLLEEFIDELTFITFPHGSDDLPFDIESDLREIEYLLNHDPTKEMDSILKDSEKFLLDLNNDLVDTIPEMFTDEHTLDYSSPPLYDDFDDDLELESVNDDVYDDLFYSKEDKIKESKLLIDELDPLRSSDFLPSHEYASFLFENFSKKISISNASLILEDFNPPLSDHELHFHKEVSGSETLLSFSSENKEKVFKPEILTSK
nr:reverse transcriptase domain-containing protein [Tanacetum cinerariifolium]